MVASVWWKNDDITLLFNQSYESSGYVCIVTEHTGLGNGSNLRLDSLYVFEQNTSGQKYCVSHFALV